MLSLHTNAASLSTQNSLAVNNKNLTSSMSKLGTGLRVNSAMDDAAGLQIATRLNAQSRGMQVAQKNTQNGISMLQTAEGAMSEVGNMLLRMKDLATESANGTSTEADRTALQAEFGALGKEISNILKNTSFAGSTLFSDNGSIGANGALAPKGTLGANTGIKFQVGATAAETIEFKPGSTGQSLSELFSKLKDVSINIGDDSGTSTTFALAGKNAAGDDLTVSANIPAAGTAEGDALALLNSKWGDTNFTATEYTNEAGYLSARADAQKTIDAYLLQNPDASLKDNKGNGTEISSATTVSGMITKLNDAINAVGTFRSDIGAVANRLDHTFNNLSNMITNTETAKGRIMDVDYATETSNMTKNQMLMQASSAMLKQSNSMSQMVSSLLQ